jgi:hypothetical protein
MLHKTQLGILVLYSRTRSRILGRIATRNVVRTAESSRVEKSPMGQSKQTDLMMFGINGHDF